MKNRPVFFVPKIVSFALFLLVCSVESFTSASDARAENCPWNCNVWTNDGTNTCNCVDGKVRSCTLIAPDGLPQRARCINPASISHLRANDCRWEGTAPFCGGSTCSPGYWKAMGNRKGDGKTCTTGSKSYCCPVARTRQNPADCFNYAKVAVESYQQARNARCEISGPEWNPSFDDHYDWCMRLNDLTIAVNGSNFRYNYLRDNCGG